MPRPIANHTIPSRSRPSAAKVARKSLRLLGAVPTVRNARTLARLAAQAGDVKAVRYWSTVARRAARHAV